MTWMVFIVENFRILKDIVVALIWPLLFLIIINRFQMPIRRFIENISEINFKAPGVEASAKTNQIEVAVSLGAAEGARQHGDESVLQKNIREIADFIAHSITPRNAKRLESASILWVDDHPENQLYERHALEALGVNFTLARSTDEALRKLEKQKFDVIISDMGRPPDLQAGYTLLEKIKNTGFLSPFIIYSISSNREQEAKVKKRGGWGTTDKIQDLFQLVVSALNEK